MNLEDKLHECDELYYELDFKGLIEKCDEILEEFPDNQNAMGYKGISHCFLDEYDEALKVLEKGVELYPNNYYLKNNLALVYYDLGEYEKSLQLCEEGLKIKGFDWLCENKMKALVKLDRMDEAIEFEKTIQHDIDLGDVLIQERMCREALEYYHNRLNDDPNDLYAIDMIKGIVARAYPGRTPDVGDYYIKWIDNIKHVEKPSICPDCGGKLIPIVWGYPSPDDLQRSFRGEVSLGGCNILIKANYHCKDCLHDFNLADEGVRIECDNPKLKRYTLFKMFSLNSILKDDSRKRFGLDEVKKGLLTFDDKEFNAFMNRLIEIGYLAQSEGGHVELVG